MNFKRGIESILYCPVCGGPVRLLFESYERVAVELPVDLAETPGTNHLAGEGKCECGKRIFASFHVTAV
jgi:hypothetical protein